MTGRAAVGDGGVCQCIGGGGGQVDLHYLQVQQSLRHIGIQVVAVLRSYRVPRKSELLCTQDIPHLRIIHLLSLVPRLSLS